jgi:tetratricopeptide (TPR) repeat protein
MKRILVLIVFAAVLSVDAAAPPHGKARLRELAVFPTLNLTFQWNYSFQCGRITFTDNSDSSEQIAELRQALKREPHDIEQLLRLGDLLNENNETNASRSYYQQAEQLCRDGLAISPQEGQLLIDLGEALYALDKKDEAESVCRKAILVSSNEWRCWVGLGSILESRSFDQLFPGKSLDTIVASANSTPQALLNYRPRPAALQKAETLRDEAAECFDHAVILAPKEPEVFLGRALYRFLSNLENLFIQHYRSNEDLNPGKIRAAQFLAKGTIQDMQQAARLSPRDYRVIGMATYYEWMNAALQETSPNFSYNTLPEDTRRSLREAMTQLENLAQDPDKKTAAGALESLGCLNMIIGVFNMTGPHAAEPYFRRAVALDPSRDTSWDMLIGVLNGESAPPADIVAVCESRLKYKNSAWNHLLLAKALQKQESWTKATEQAMAAIKLETNNVAAHLMFFALCLRQSSDPRYLTIAATDMKSVSTNALNSIVSESEKADRERELILNLAILEGLDDQPERAKELLRTTVLKKDPEDKDAKEIMSALE